MNIGMVCFPTYGGSGVVATELGKALAKKGHKVHFMSYSQPFRLNLFDENLFYHEFNVNDYPLFEFQPYESVLASKIVDVAIYEQLDVLHVHYAIPHASVAYMAQQILKSKKIYLPYVTTLHGTDITLVGRDPAFEPVIRFSLNHSNALTSVSESLKKDTLSTFKIDNKISVIPNFINLSEYETPLQNCNKRVYAPNDERILVHISNFRKVKRVEDVIAIFERVKKEVPCKLLLVGDGPEKAAIDQLCRQLNISHDVINLGKIADPKEILSVADLFILPSETESFGLSALEAMAMKVPVISTNSGGLPEVNINGKTGYLSEVGNVEEMANNALKLLTDEKLFNQFRENAFAQAKKFDIVNILPMYEKLYHQLVSEHAVSA
ncbi:MAG: N-acetyl-alpha-D-glucosaminyl L-malate synthase BshA [Bacteroidota bacterium]|nr:N-acetyl-alpha-D-glucosaminyl L-malate synthase BshA [Bacteroidota bacterium]MDP3145713.1 N-acetyl-alpha-D-glucosaminyl L-malate synthase BshA [Bacteroidota bacterium]MDP3558406.1 N-acetyl-alpha-D-glucosaminyl L-malate synthase BshA [Bacteroidota bacterium]